MNRQFARIKVLLATPRGWMAAVSGALIVSLKFAPALIVVVTLFWMQRERIGQESMAKAARDYRWPIIGFLLLWPLVCALGGGLAPLDDAFRHVTAYLNGYDYTDLYIHLDPRFPHKSMWIGYEYIGGHLHRLLGLKGAVLSLQAFFYACAAYCLWRIAKVLVPDREDAWTWRLLLVAVMLLSGLLFRLSLARPEALLAIWALSAIWMRPALWLGIGLVLQPMYWLAVIYAPAALLLKASLRSRVIIGAIIVAAGLGFWFWYAGRDWMTFFGLLGEWLKNRLGTVTENEPIQSQLFHPTVLATLIVLCWKGRPQLVRDWPMLATLAWFLLPGQVRYMAVVAPLLFAFAVRAVPLPTLTARGRIVVWAVVAALSLSVLLSDRFKISYEGKLPHFKHLPADARLLTTFNEAAFVVPAEHPGVKSAPPMELGATSKPVQKLVAALHGSHDLDCASLRQLGFTHVVENELQATAECLELVEIQNIWRLWRVR